MGVHTLVGFVFISKKLILCHTLRIPSMDLASVHCPNQHLIKLASNLAQKIVVVVSFSHTRFPPRPLPSPTLYLSTHPSFQPKCSRDSAMSPQFLPSQEHSALQAVLSTPSQGRHSCLPSHLSSQEGRMKQQADRSDSPSQGKASSGARKEV